MRVGAVATTVLLLSSFAFSQAPTSNPSQQPQVAQAPAAQTPQPTSYANFSIMLVNPVMGGTSVVLMHNPKNELEFVAVNNTQKALQAGYAPVRAIELDELIGALREENARLTTENTRLESEHAQRVAIQPRSSSTSSEVTPEAQRAAQLEAAKAARRQQIIDTWLRLQNLNRPQTQNLNVTISDCTRNPALCAGPK